MRTHPEIGQEYLTRLSQIARRGASSYKAAQNEAYLHVWNECMVETNIFLSRMCPAITSNPIDEIERQIQLQDVLDEELGDYEEEEI